MPRLTEIQQFHRLEFDAGSRNPKKITDVRGLYVRPRSKTKEFVVITSGPDGKQVWKSLETNFDLEKLTNDQLSDVKQLAEATILRIKRGEAALPEKLEPEAIPNTLCDVGNNFLDLYVREKGLLSEPELRRHLEKYVYPFRRDGESRNLGDTSINDINLDHVTPMLDSVQRKVSAIHADKVQTTLKTVFRWHSGRSATFTSPLVGTPKRTKPKERARKRRLSPDELRLLWPILETSGTFGAMVRTQLLTSQRQGKVMRMRWADLHKRWEDSDGEIHNNVWVIAKDHPREKGHGEALPLPGMAWEIIDAQPKIEGNEFVFAASRGDQHFSGFSKAKRSLDGKLLAALKAAAVERGEDPDAVELDDWRLHDLRRTARSWMSAARVPGDYAEITLGHARPIIESIYDVADYTEIRGETLEALAARVKQILNPPPDNVIEIRAG